MLAPLALFAGFAGSPAQAYPDKPITVLHGFAPGGGADVLARIVLPKVGEILGQQILIDYRTGAGGNLAIEAVVRAPADGYTLLLGTPNLAINPSLYAKLPFEPLRDLMPISLIGTVQSVLVVTPSLPVKTVAELVALARQKPGKLNFASSGVGTSLHLAGELFKMQAGIDMTHVPYRGGMQAVNDVVGGQVETMFNVLPSALPLIQAGRLRALAVTGKTRSEVLPDTPTMIEAGVPGYVSVTWNGLLAPAATPPDVIAKLNAAIVQAMQSPDIKKKLGAIGQDVAWSTPQEFRALIESDTGKWAKVIKAAGIKPE
jgi:tripartite-type tricarboxylate transporter receptor subunit TctC